MKPLVYLAGPYTRPDPVDNTKQAIEFGRYLRDKYQVCVITPHFSMFEHFLIPSTYEYWLSIDFDYIEHCQCLYRMPGDSSGADKEVEWATALKLPVFFDEYKFEQWRRNWR